MFGSNTLSLPASFAHEHRPLRLSSNAARPQPTGQCHYQLVHPSAKNQICSCQIYQHNRSAPGNVCDCGHSACYHGALSTRPPEPAPQPTADLADKIKNLEGMILAERKIRDSMIARERATWERDVRILREALAPFYTNEETMQRKLEEIEHKIDGSLEEQVRLRERFEAISEASMTIEKQYAVSEIETASSHGQHHISSPPNTSVNNGDDVPGLTSGDERSSSSSFSRTQTPSEAMIPIVEPKSPRSSGILNLVSFPRPAVPPYMIPQRPVSQIVIEEPRSSGWLGVDIREHVKARMNRKQNEVSTSASPMLGPNQKTTTVTSMNMSPPATNRHSTPRSLSRISPPVTGYVSTGHTYEEVRPPKKRKHQTTNLMALDVLADVSAASPLIS